MPTALATPLPERPGRDLDAGHVAALGVARSARAPLAEALQVLDRQVEAAQVRQRVLQHAGVPGREHEAVAVAPSGVGGIQAQHVPVERVGQRRQRHRRAGVAGVCLLHRVHRQPADRVDRQSAHIALAVGEHRHTQSAGLGATAIACDPSGHASDARRRPCAGHAVSLRRDAWCAAESRPPNDGVRASTGSGGDAHAPASAGRGDNVSADMASADAARGPAACARRLVLSYRSNLRVGSAIGQVVQLMRTPFTVTHNK